MRLDIPAVIIREITVIGGLSKEGVSDPESDLRFRIADMLISSSSFERANCVVRKACLVVNEALRVSAGARELDEDDGIILIFDRCFVVCFLRVNQDAEQLVMIDIAWRHVMQKRCVSHRVPGLALVILIF